MLDHHTDQVVARNGATLDLDRNSAEDRRWSPRREMKLEVLVFHRGTALALGHTRDVGLEGMYLEASCPEISRHSLVEVEFTLPDDADGNRHRIPALVVRISKDGFGLMFISFDRRVFYWFQSAVDPV